MSVNDELQVLFPEREFASSVGVILVLPFRFGDFVKVLEIINKYGDFLAQDDFIAAFFAEGGEAIESLKRLVLMSCRELDEAILNELPGDEALNLIFQVVEVNSDFFVRNILKGSSNLSRRLEQLKNPGALLSAG